MHTSKQSDGYQMFVYRNLIKIINLLKLQTRQILSFSLVRQVAWLERFYCEYLNIQCIIKYHQITQESEWLIMLYYIT